MDFTDLTCTNLMIRLKLLLKEIPGGEALRFIVRRDQRDTVEAFSRTGFSIRIREIDRNRFIVRMEKEAGEGSS